MNKKINVLFDATVLSDRIISKTGNGIFFATYNILMELIKRNDLNITLYCALKKRPQMIETLKINESLANLSLCECSNFDSIIAYWENLKYKNDNKLVKPLIKLTISVLKFVKRIKEKLNLDKEYEELFKDIDVFFSTCDAVPEDIEKIKHIKNFTILYDLIPMILPEYNQDWLKKKGYFYKLAQSITKDDYYFAISEFTKQDFIKHFPELAPEKVKVIPLSTGLKYEKITDKEELDRIRAKYNIPVSKKYLFSLCTLEPRKNLLFAVKNFIEFIKRYNIDDFVFVLGGGQWDNFVKTLKNTIDDMDEYKDKIIKIGYVEDEDMPALYSGAEMFVFPSIYEGFGMPIMEAMKSGCPVICSNVTSMPEVLGDCGIQIDPTNNEDLIKAFEKMYFDDKFREQCAKKGLKRAEEFSWKKCADVIINEF